MKTITHGNDENIQIRQVLMNGDKIQFVEYYSANDSRNHIINADRFCEIFGFSIEDLKKLQTQKEK